MRIAIIRLVIISIFTMGVSSWSWIPNYFGWRNSQPQGLNSINHLPPCDPHGKPTPPAAESSSTEVLPLTSSEVASTSALAEAFSSMELSPVASSQATTSAEAMNPPVSSQVQDVVPAGSTLPDPVILSSQAQFVVAPLSTTAQAYVPVSSQAQAVQPAASTVVVAINPPASSQVPDLLPSFSGPGDVVNSPASSLVQEVPAATSLVEDVSPPASSVVQEVPPVVSATAHIVEPPAATSLAQESLSPPSTFIDSGSLPVSSVVEPVVLSSDPATDANSPNSLATPSVEAAASTQVDASIAPASSVEVVVPIEGHIAPADASLSIAPEASAPASGQTKPRSKKSSKKASKTAPKNAKETANPPLYQNGTVHSNATGVSNSTSNNATLTSDGPTVGSTESPVPQCALPASPMCCTPTETIHGAMTPATGFTCKPASHVRRSELFGREHLLRQTSN